MKRDPGWRCSDEWQPMGFSLYQPDVFSEPVAERRGFEASVAAEVITVLNSHYPTLEVTDQEVQLCGGFGINSTNYFVSTSAGDVFVKRKAGTAGKEKLAEKANLSDALRRRGAPIPAFSPNRSGGLVTESAGDLWAVQTFVEAPYFTGRKGELHAVARLVGKLSSELLGLGRALFDKDTIAVQSPNACDALMVFGDSVEDWPAWLGDELSGRLIESWSDIVIPAVSAYRAARERHPVVPGVFHIDLHPHNLMMAETEVVALLDWESFASCDLICSVGFAVVKLARQSVVAGGAPEDTLDAARRYSEAAGLEVPAEDLIALGCGEVVRRLQAILNINKDCGDRSWNHVFDVQLAILAESLQFVR